MPRGTAAVRPKPPTAREIERLQQAYEPTLNAIVEATKRFDPESVAGIEGRWLRETAFDLHAHLKALHDFVADEENERKGPRA